MTDPSATSLAILAASSAEVYSGGPYVVVVRTAEEFTRWLRDPRPGAEALQAEGLIGCAELWSLAAQGTVPIPIDVVLTDPAAEYSALYRLVDVHNARDVRVTIPVAPGFLKAMRLAVSLHLPVRLLPGQPDARALAELAEAMEFYLRHSLVETPVEFFHSTFSAMCGPSDGTLWTFLEQDPETFSTRDVTGRPLLPVDFVDTHLHQLMEAGGECATCRWQGLCAGYFKHPDPTYDCAGIKGLFADLESAAAEITGDLATHSTGHPEAP